MSDAKKLMPIAWVMPSGDRARDDGFLDAMAWQEGEFSHPLCSLEEAADEITRLRAEVERLRLFESRVTGDGMENASRYWEARYRDEAAEVERLRAALKPFAELAEDFDDGTHDHNVAYVAVLRLHRAREAMGEKASA